MSRTFSGMCVVLTVGLAVAVMTAPAQARPAAAAAVAADGSDNAVPSSVRGCTGTACAYSSPAGARTTFHRDASSGEEIYICDTVSNGRGAAMKYKFASTGGARIYRAFDLSGADGGNCTGRYPEMVEGRTILFKACLSEGRTIADITCSAWRSATA